MIEIMKKNILIIFVLLPILSMGQMQQVKLFGKYKGLVSDEENTQGFLFQSLDGAKSCEGKIVLDYEGSIVSSITVDLNGCGVLMNNFGKAFVFQNPEKTEDTDDSYYFIENSEASGRIRVAEDVYYLENLIPKVQTGKVRYRFVYNESELQSPKETSNASENVVANGESDEVKSESDEETGQVKEEINDIQIEDNSEEKSIAEVKEEQGIQSEGTQASGGYFMYTLKEGDYIYKLAREYQCSPIDLMRINNIEEGRTLYPGEQIKLCGSGNGYEPPIAKSSSNDSQVTTKPKEFDEAKSLKAYGEDMKSEYESLVGTYNELRKSYKSLEKENFSLKTYSEEMKMEYELLVSEFDKVRASYNSLMAEYKELVADYKKVKKENEALKKLVKQLQGGSKEDLSDEEQAKVEELQSKLGTFKDQLKDMREKLEDAKEDGDDLQFEMEDTKDNIEDQKGDDSSDSKSSENSDNGKGKVNPKDLGASGNASENIVDPENNTKVFDEFTAAYEALLVEEPGVYGSVVFSKSMTMNLASDGAITNLNVEGTDAIDKKDNVKKSEELLNGDLIKMFENLKLAGVGEKRSKLIADFNKKSFQIKIKKGNLKFLSDNADDIDGSHPYIKLILDKYKEEGSKPGTYRVNIFDGNYQLNEMSNDGSEVIFELASDKNQYVSKFQEL
jgi:LysM repeat protein